jgi:hypothetical protein
MTKTYFLRSPPPGDRHILRQPLADFPSWKICRFRAFFGKRSFEENILVLPKNVADSRTEDMPVPVRRRRSD